MNRFLILGLTVFMLPSSLLAQPDDLIWSTRAWGNPNFCSGILKLNSKQTEFQQTFYARSVDMQKQLIEESGYSKRAARQEVDRRLNEELFEALDNEQQDKFLRWLRFRAAGGTWRPRTLISRYAQELLKLDESQVQKLRELETSFSERSKKFTVDNKIQIENLISQAVSEIDSTLTPMQREKKRKLIGEPFVFRKVMHKQFSKAMDGCTTAKSLASSGGWSSSSSSAEFGDVSFLSFCFSPQVIDVKPVYVALVELAANDAVVEELGISPEQQDVISARLDDLKFQMKGVVEIRQDYSNQDSSTIFDFTARVKGDSEEVSSFETKKMSTKDNHENEFSDFLAEFSPQQSKRLIELFYRWIAETGGRYKFDGIAEFHPGWVDYLELDKEQVKSIAEVMQTLEEDTAKQDALRTTQQTVEPIRAYLRALEFLSREQQAIWEYNTGPYSDVPQALVDRIKMDGA